jgi:uncharacterized membrane protein
MLLLSMHAVHHCSSRLTCNVSQLLLLLLLLQGTHSLLKFPHLLLLLTISSRPVLAGTSLRLLLLLLLQGPHKLTVPSASTAVHH